MWKFAVIAVAVLGLTAGAADALDIKNVRSTYGPVGSVRPGSKFLPGDVILLVFDIEGLKIDENGNARYTTSLEFFDTKKESKFKKDTPNQQVLALGGTTVVSYATVGLGVDLVPGKYSAKISATDRATKETTSFTYDFEILAADFGFIQPFATSYAPINSDYAAQVIVCGMGKDAKKLPNVDVHVRVFDDQGKQTLAKPLSINIPKDFDELPNKDYVTVPIPLYLSRVGQFRVEIEAVDNISKKTAKISFPLKVVDSSAVK